MFSLTPFPVVSTHQNPSTESLDSQISPSATGFTDKSHHNFTLDTMDLQLDVTLNDTAEDDLQNELNLTESELNTLIDKTLAIPNSLSGSTIDIYVGNKSETAINGKTAFIAPSLITSQNITVPKELFALSPNISEEAAAQLEFSLPKKSAICLISPYAPFISPTLTGEGGSSPSTMITSSFQQLFSGFSDQPSSLQMSVPSAPYGIPYDYGNLTQGAFLTPVPFTDTTADLDTIGQNLARAVNITTPFNASYDSTDETGTFTASGKTSGNGFLLPSSDANITLDQLKSSYDLSSGILQNYQLGGDYVEQDQYGNKIEASFSFEMSYNDGKSFHFGVSQGDVFGFTFTNATTIESGLFDAINETTRGALPGNLPGEGTTAGLLQDIQLEMESTGEAFNRLGHAYNASLTVPDGTTSHSMFISNPFGFSAPSVLSNWKLQHSIWQTQAHIQNKIIPNFLNAEIVQDQFLNLSEKVSYEINNDYSILAISSGDSYEWTSLKNEIDISAGYNETTSDLLMCDLSISGNTWYTYTGTGKLTEIGVSLTIDITYDSDEDNSLADESTESFDIELSFNRVQNTATITSQQGEPSASDVPDYTQPIDAPDATDSDADWEDVTPYVEPEGPAGDGGDGLLDSTMLLIVGGVIGVIIIGVLIFAFKGRKKEKD